MSFEIYDITKNPDDLKVHLTDSIHGCSLQNDNSSFESFMMGLVLWEEMYSVLKNISTEVD